MIRLLSYVSLLPLTVFPTLSAEPVKVTTKGGLKVSYGEYQFKFGGRIMYDYNRAEENGVVDEDSFSLRRARVYASGNVSKNWSFKTQFFQAKWHLLIPNRDRRGLTKPSITKV